MAFERYFSIEGNNGSTQLYFFGEPIDKSGFLNEAKAVLKTHIVPDLSPRRLYESLVFCIASQSMVYERAVDLLDRIGSIREPEFSEPERIYKIARPNLRFPEDRFTSALRFVTGYDGGITELARDYFRAPTEVREMLVSNVQWLAHKTASFWYLCLGGTELMTIDIHNLRQIAGLGPIQVERSLYEGKSRRGGKTKGKQIVKAISPRDYRRLEDEVLAALGHIPCLKDKRGNPNGALITTLFWWAGAKGKREILEQQSLPGLERTLFRPPYSL